MQTKHYDPMRREFGTKGATDHGTGDSADVKAQLDRIAEQAGTRVSELAARVQTIEQAHAKSGRGGSPGMGAPDQLDLAPIFQDATFQSVQKNAKGANCHFALGEISAKSLLNYVGETDTANGTYHGQPSRAPDQLASPLRRLRLLDVLPARPITTNTAEYVQVSWTGEADLQDGEGAQKAEMDFDSTPVTAYVQTIAVHTTVSAQVLDDQSSLEATLQRIMAHSGLAKLEQQLLVGSGVGSTINGLFTQGTAITTYENEIPDRIGRAITEMEITGHVPNAIMMNPRDWFAISILKDSQGRYLYGNPASPAQPTLWNRPVITNPNVPAGTALVGDTEQQRVLDRMQPTVFLSRDYLDYRTRNLVLILVELRAGLEVYNTGAFRKVDLSTAT